MRPREFFDNCDDLSKYWVLLSKEEAFDLVEEEASEVSDMYSVDFANLALQIHPCDGLFSFDWENINEIKEFKYSDYEDEIDKYFEKMLLKTKNYLPFWKVTRFIKSEEFVGVADLVHELYQSGRRNGINDLLYWDGFEMFEKRIPDEMPKIDKYENEPLYLNRGEVVFLKDVIKGCK